MLRKISIVVATIPIVALFVCVLLVLAPWVYMTAERDVRKHSKK